VVEHHHDRVGTLGATEEVAEVRPGLRAIVATIAQSIALDPEEPGGTAELLVGLDLDFDDLRAGHEETMRATKTVVERTPCYRPPLR